MNPEIEVVLEQVSGGILVERLLAPSIMHHISSPHSTKTNTLIIRRSQVALSLNVRGTSSEKIQSVSFLRNGSYWAPRSNQSFVASAQFILEDDIEHHTISCVVNGKYVYCAQVEVIAQREWRSTSESFFAPKWGRHQVTMELTSYAAAKPKAAHKRSLLDHVARRLIRGTSTDTRDSVQALHHTACQFAALCARLRRNELFPDYATEIDLEIDVDSTVDLLQRHPEWLTESADGPITLGERKYTSAQVVFGRANSEIIDLRIPISLLGICISFISESIDCFSSSLILSTSRNALQKHSDVTSPQSRPTEIVEWFKSEASNPTTSRLRTLLLRVLALTRQTHFRGDQAHGGLSGLSRGFRDADLFEWSAFSAICTALQGDPIALKTGAAAIEAGPHRLINVNRPGGAEYVTRLLPGWRDLSEMPAGYKPDYIIHFERSFPIPVDAKFRVSASLTSPCSADSIKDIQAYLDEFGVAGAIVLVPAIPSNLAAGGCISQAVRINGSIRGRERRIWIIEHAPGLTGFDTNLKKAIDDLASLAHFELAGQ